MNSQKNDGAVNSHKLSLMDRGRLELTGIKDVGTFDEKEMTLFSERGKMLIKGEQLHVEKLDLGTGEVSVNGRVDSIQYQNKAVKSQGDASWIKSLFR